MSKNSESALRDRLESTLAQLASTDLSVASDAVKVYRGIVFDEKSKKSYMAGNENRILTLLSDQLRNFFTHYWAPGQGLSKFDELYDFFVFLVMGSGKLPKFNQLYKKNAMLKRLLLDCTDIIRELYLFYPVKFIKNISHETTKQVMQSFVPFLQMYLDKDSCLQESKLDPWLMGCVKHMHNTIVSLLVPYTPPSEPIDRQDVRVVAQFVSVILQLIRDYTERIHSDPSSCAQIDHRTTFTYLLEIFMREKHLGDGHGKKAQKDLHRLVKQMDASSVLLEMSALIELYSGFGQFDSCSELPTIDCIRSFILLVFEIHGDKAWWHFSLIDKEIGESGKSPENVALFKLLAKRGIVRPCHQAPNEAAKEPEVFELVDHPFEDFEHVEAHPEVPETAESNADSQAEAKQSKAEILNKVQKIYDEIIKSQGKINELLSKV